MKIYLAAPYTHHCAVKRIERFNKVNEVAARLMNEGHIVFSPISHSHPIAEHLKPELLTDHDWWMNQDLSFIGEWADELHVLRLPGWNESKGVFAEINFAVDNAIPIRYIDF